MLDNPSNATATSDDSKESEILLDDFLWAISNTRRQHALSKPTYSRERLSETAGYDQTLRKIVGRIIKRHGRNIFARPHPLLDELKIALDDAPVLRETCQVNRLPADVVHASLEKILELAISTVVELPSTTKVGHSTQKLNRLAGRWETLARDAEAVLNDPETRERILVHSKTDAEISSTALLHAPKAVQRFATAFRNVVSQTKVTRSRFNSPNPQVNFALFIVGWIGHATDRPSYSILQLLMQAAFTAAGKATPKWVDRLSIEMVQRRRRRKAFIRSITIPFQADPIATAPTPLTMLVFESN